MQCIALQCSAVHSVQVMHNAVQQYMVMRFGPAAACYQIDFLERLLGKAGEVSRPLNPTRRLCLVPHQAVQLVSIPFYGKAGVVGYMFPAHIATGL
jgi:hypothetical protein